jgi:hypothetical protein
MPDQAGRATLAPGLDLLLPAAFLAHDLGELVSNDELNRAAHP